MKKLLSYAFLCLVALIMAYPLVWLVFSSFKPNSEIFGSIRLLPQKWQTDSYILGWRGTGQNSFGRFLCNTLELVVPTAAFTTLSSCLVGYGFARFQFPLKKMLMVLMISTLMLPNTVLVIPRFILFNRLGWNDTYYPFIVPAMFACTPFFIYMMIQFFRGIPRDLDDAAKIDGCGSFQTLIYVLLPILKPALFSAFLFQFIWTWNDFFNVLIYISSVSKYPVSLALRMSLDSASAVNWSTVLAMSLVSMIPCILVYMFGQKYLIDGMATQGIKG